MSKRLLIHDMPIMTTIGPGLKILWKVSLQGNELPCRHDRRLSRSKTTKRCQSLRTCRSDDGRLIDKAGIRLTITTGIK